MFSGWFSAGAPVEAASAKRGAIREFIDEQAKTRLPETYLITMLFQGRIEAVALSEGMSVKKDEVVARIVPRDLDLAVEEAAAAVQRPDASIKENADVSVEDTAYRQAKQFVLSTLAAVKAALERVRAGRAKYDYAEKDLTRIQQLAATKARPQDMEVEADVLTLDVVTAKIGNHVEIYGPAIGKPSARGVVTRIFPAGFTKTSSLGVEQQRVKVIIRFDKNDLNRLLTEHGLGVGYRVRVRIFTAENPDALIVPRTALFRSANNQWQVYAVRGDRARIQDVEVGLMNDEHVEITKGLKQGDLVILVPESSLTDGTRITAKIAE